MGNFLKSTKCRVILCILALLIGIMIYAVSVGGYTISGIGMFNSMTAPLQRASNSISERVEYWLSMYSNAEYHYEQNKVLREEIAALHAELADYEQTKERLADLEAFVGIKEMHEDFNYSAPCEVTGYVTNDPFGAFTIHGGTADGISLHDPVVTDTGLVGVITEVGRDTATVTTILSPEVSVAAYCSTTKDHGVVTGSVAEAMKGRCKLQYLDKDTSLKRNRVILTSGDSGLFPKGYVIGYVRELGMDDSGMTAYAAIEPAADLANLNMVVVITDFEGKEAVGDAE